MPEFSITDTRLVLRYERGSYSISRLMLDAADENLFELAATVANVQSEQPKQVIKMVTRMLV